MKIGISGAAGRMGQALTRQVEATEGCILVAATEVPGHPALGRDCGALAGIEPLGVAVSDDPQAMFRAADAVLDFTLPGATAGHAKLAAAEGTILVVGTTGIGEAEQAALKAAAAQTAVVQAPNMSLAVNLLMRLTEQVAGLLDADYDIEIVEMHHRHKIDAPSGTALGLGRAAARARGVSFDEVAARGRDGVTARASARRNRLRRAARRRCGGRAQRDLRGGRRAAGADLPLGEPPDLCPRRSSGGALGGGAGTGPLHDGERARPHLSACGANRRRRGPLRPAWPRSRRAGSRGCE